LDKQKRNGKVRYYVTNRINGRPQKKFVGYSSKDARAENEKRRTQIREGHVREILRHQPITFQELTDWFLSIVEEEIQQKEKARAKGKERKGKGRGYQKRIKSALKAFNEVFGETLAIDITYDGLVRYMNGQEESIGPYTLDVEMAIIKSMISLAFDRDKVGGRVFQEFRKISTIAPPEAKRRKRVITVDEYRKLLQAAQPSLYAMMVIAMVTGMRPAEIRKLRWFHLDPENDMMHMPGEITKNGKPRSIPLCEQVHAVLGSLNRYPHDYVITEKQKPVTDAGWVKRVMKKTCTEAKLPYGKKTPDGKIKCCPFCCPRRIYNIDFII
jgi:integrase